MALGTRGLFAPFDVAVEQKTVIEAFTREFFINEAPLMTRLKRQPVAGDHFDIVSYDVRPRDYTLGAAIGSTGATTITLNDVTPILVGDVLEIGTERLEVIGNIVVATNNCDVKRAVEGTTAATALINAAVKLIGNSRTGAEIDQEASRNVRTVAHQYVQTWQVPVQVGGLVGAISNLALPAGVTSVEDQSKMVKLIEMVRDIEYSSVYGVGEAPSSGGRIKQKGLKALIDSGNYTAAGATGFTPLNFVTNLVAKARTAGGAPDVALVSSDLALVGLTTWGLPIQRGIEKTTVLGLDIEEFEVPFTGGPPLRFVMSPQLKNGTAIVLTSREVQMRVLRPEFWNERGNRGDTTAEGEWIASMAIELVNPKHHAMQEGIVSYAAA